MVTKRIRIPVLIGSIAKNEVSTIAKSPRWISVCILYALLFAASFGQFLSVQQSLSVSVTIMGSVTPYIILGLPLIGVMMCFDFASSGFEDNTFALLLSQPITRVQMYTGMILSRLFLIAAPFILSATALLLLFARPLTIDLFEKFALTMLVLTLGALFWLVLSVAISTAVRRTVPSLIYCFTTVFLLAYQSYNLIPLAIISMLSGAVVVPDQGFPNARVYLMQVYGNELIPGNQLPQFYTLFENVTINSWLLGRAGEGMGLPVYLLLAYLVILTVVLVFIGAMKFQRIDL